MLTVRVGKREPKLTVLTVDNYAPDIAAAERERVLERFCQAPGTEKRAAGRNAVAW